MSLHKFLKNSTFYFLNLLRNFLNIAESNHSSASNLSSGNLQPDIEKFLELQICVKVQVGILSPWHLYLMFAWHSCAAIWERSKEFHSKLPLPSKIDNPEKIYPKRFFFSRFKYVVKNGNRATLPSCLCNNEQHNQHLTFDADQPKKLHHPETNVGSRSTSRYADSFQMGNQYLLAKKHKTTKFIQCFDILPKPKTTNL